MWLISSLAALLAQPASAASCTLDRSFAVQDTCGASVVGTARRYGTSTSWCGTSGLAASEVALSLVPPLGRAVVVTGVVAPPKGLSAPAIDLDLFLLDGGCTTSSRCASSVLRAGLDAATSFVGGASAYGVVLDATTPAASWPWGLEVRCDGGCPSRLLRGRISCSTSLDDATTSSPGVVGWYRCGGGGPVGQGGPDAVYAFAPQQDGPVTARLGGLLTDHDLYVLDDACAGSACVAAGQGTSTGDEVVTFDARAGRTYFLAVEAPGGPGPFSLSIDAGPGQGCAEDCDDGGDDDGDDLVDCDDPDCDGDAPCGGCDVDGDGAAAIGCGGADCADDDATVHPGAVEVVDGVDDDCDGVVDDGTAAHDGDGDGYAPVAGDCDDLRASVHPGAVEVCDGIDEDCDHVPDDGTSCHDDDGDGVCEVACTDGTTPGDCDDTDPAIAPFAVDVAGDGRDGDCDGVVDGAAPDPDGDGVSAAGGDCDDADPHVRPGATERANGVDDDCDGTIDDGTAAHDDDGDGASEDEGDCADDDASVHPGAVEDADGVDDDCDGRVDDGTDVVDDDGDGWAETGGDCDDGAATVYPGAPDRRNGVDDDCDGEVDEEDADVDGDRATVAQGDCDDEDGFVYPGAFESCDGVDDDCDGEIDEGCADAIPGGQDPPVDCGCDTGRGGPWPLLGLVVLGLRRRRCLAAAVVAGCSQEVGLVDVPAELSVTPPILDLGVTGVGTAVDGLVALELVAGKGAGIDGVTVTQLYGPAFTYEGPQRFWVDADHPAAIGFAFEASAEGYAQALVEITSSARWSPHVVELRARAREAAIHFDPPVLDLGPVEGGRRVTGQVDVIEVNGATASFVAVRTDPPELSVGVDVPFEIHGGQGELVAVTWQAGAATLEGTVRFVDAWGVETPPLFVRANQCARGTPEAYDRDEDGVTVCGGDCDDRDRAIRPGLAELADGDDQDCDGAIDEGTAAADDDGDGWCEGPRPCVGRARPGDCDDEDPTVSPGRPDVAGNGVDDDCSGAADADALDADLDGRTAAAGDCDDHDPTVRPGVLEVPNGVDDDCDGWIDDQTPARDDDGDTWCEVGPCATGRGDGDCDDTSWKVFPGAPEVANGRDDDCDGRVDEGTTSADDDGDGFTEVGGDCDDGDATRSPALGTCP